MNELARTPRWKADLTLVLITLVWGSTFSITKMGLTVVPPLLFIAFRFTLAGVIVLPLAWSRTRGLSARQWRIGIAVGVVQFLGFALQTAGLGLTTASKAAFITGLSVVLVPLLLALFWRQQVGLWAIFGSVSAFLGTAVLSLEPGRDLFFSVGDFLVLGCAFAFAWYIVLVGRYANDVDPLALTAVQIYVTAALSLAAGFVFERLDTPVPFAVWAGLAFLAVFATIGTTWAQAWAQRHSDPVRTAIIFALEPVFAAVFAYLALGETQSLRTLLGGFLILLGICLAELTGIRPGKARPNVDVTRAADSSR